MSRLFISHSSRDNVYALAFQNWLAANGWDPDDVFVDLHDIGAGQRWRETLRKANAACEAIVLLASPEALGSIECQKELELAEYLGKEIIVAILRDLSKDDVRLARYSDRQFADLSAFPQDQIEALTWEGRDHRIAFNRDALTKIKSRLDELGIAPQSFAWPPKGAIDPEPYPGLSAFGEQDAGIFFGRDADILKALTEIRLVRRRRSPRVIVIDAASGAGKSSFLRAGVWPRLKRDPEFAPIAVLRPARGIISGPDGAGRALASWFERYGHTRAAGDIYAPLLSWNMEEAQNAFAALIKDAVAVASAARRAVAPDARDPAPLLAIDQAEELFASEDDAESRRFLDLLAHLLKKPPDGIDPYLLLTIRADSVQSLLERMSALGLDTPQPFYLLPLSHVAYRDVILKPAELYADRVRRLNVEPSLADALVSDASGADALPLLAFTLARMFADYKGDGQLTLKRYEDTGGVGGSIGKALKQAQIRTGAAGTDDCLRRLLLPRLATWDPEADRGKGGAKRLVGRIDDVLGGGRATLRPLADALVEARLLSRGRETIEVAHEALLRRPPIRNWLAEDREFLMWRDGLGKTRAAYEASKRGLLVGRELQIARDWLDQRTDQHDIAPLDRAFIEGSIAEDEERRTKEQEREQRHQAAELEAARAREQIALQAAEPARLREAAALQEAKAREAAAALDAQSAKERERLAELEAAAARERESASKEVAARALAGRTALGLAASLVLAVVASALGYYAYGQSKIANEKAAFATKEQQVAVKAQKAADDARRDAQLAQSKFLTDASQRSKKSGDAVTAILLALEALPDPESESPMIRDRPPWTPADFALQDARQALQERLVIGHGDDVNSVAFSPDGERGLTGSNDKTARLWDTKTGAALSTLTGHQGPIWSVAFSPDGGRILTGSGDKTVRLWDAKTGSALLTLKGHEGEVYSVAFSRPDGARILTGSADRSARLWDAKTGAPLLMLKGHEGAERSAAFSPDGASILTGSADRTARLWDAKTGSALLTFKEGRSGVNSVAFSPDGARIVTSSRDRTARLWDAKQADENLVKATKQNLPRCLSEQQREANFLSTDSPTWCMVYQKWPYNSVGRLNRGRELLSQEADDEARTVFAALRNNDPSSAPRIDKSWADALLSRGVDALANDKDGDAKDFFEKAKAHSVNIAPRIDEAWADALLSRGADALANAKDSEAKDFFDRARAHSGNIAPRIDEAWADALLSRGIDALANAKDSEAKDFFDKARTHNGNIAPRIDEAWADALLSRGADALANDKDSEAKDLFEKAMAHDAKFAQKVDEAWVDRFIERGDAALSDGRLDDAVKHFADAKARDVSSASKIVDKIVSRVNSTLNSAKEAEPGERNSKRDLALAIVDASRKFFGEDAERDVRARIALTRGRVLDAKENYAEAAAEFEAAREGGNENAGNWLFWARDRLGQKLLKDGKAAESLVVRWNNILELDPSVRAPIEMSDLKSIRIEYSMAELSRNARAPVNAADCDKEAGHPFDALGAGAGIEFERISDPTSSIARCDSEIATQPSESRFVYQRGRLHSRAAQLAEKAEDSGRAKSEREAAFADFEAAMAKGYPIAFVNMGVAYARGEGKDKDLDKAGSFYIEALNRTLHCCWAPVARQLLAEEQRLDPAKVRPIVRELTLWSAALGSEESKSLLAELTRNGTIEAAPSLRPARFFDLPPWLRDEWNASKTAAAK